MEEKKALISLTPESYVDVQNEIAKNVANESNKIIECRSVLLDGQKEISEREKEIKRLQYEILDIKNKCKKINLMLKSSQRSIKVDTRFLDKLNRNMRRSIPTTISVEKRLVKRR